LSKAQSDQKYSELIEHLRFRCWIINFTGIEYSSRNIVSQASSTHVNEAIRLHHSMAAALSQHAGLCVPALCSRIVAFEQIQCRISLKNKKPTKVALILVAVIQEESNSNYQICFVSCKGKGAFPPLKIGPTNSKFATIQKAHTCNCFLDSFVPKYLSL